ncbi:MAG: hypothetical protein ABL889_16155 [Terricaulis sp.]
MRNELGLSVLPRWTRHVRKKTQVPIAFHHLTELPLKRNGEVQGVRNHHNSARGLLRQHPGGVGDRDHDRFKMSRRQKNAEPVVDANANHFQGVSHGLDMPILSIVIGARDGLKDLLDESDEVLAQNCIKHS